MLWFFFKSVNFLFGGFLKLVLLLFSVGIFDMVVDYLKVYLFGLK